MNGTEIKCRRCGMMARLISVEGEVFAARPRLLQIIECPQCGSREQLDGADNKRDAVDAPA
jgi:hypothetical protein